jgi:glutamate synthase (NADPH/NADH) large chain
MTGGMVWVYDPERRFANSVNPESIKLRAVSDAHKATLKGHIEAHFDHTQSPRAKAIMDDWDTALGAFVEVIPLEILALEGKAEKKSA